MADVGGYEIVFVATQDRIADVAVEVVVGVEVGETARPHIGQRQVAPLAAEKSRGGFDLAIARVPGAGEQIWLVTGSGTRMYSCEPCGGETPLQQQAAAEALIQFGVGDVGFRRPQVGLKDVAVRDRRPRSVPFGAKRVTRRASNVGKASTLSGVRCTKLP